MLLDSVLTEEETLMPVLDEPSKEEMTAPQQQSGGRMT